MHHAISPEGVAPPAAAYALAVLSDPATRMLHTSGIVPTRPDGSTPAELGEQADVVWATIRALLEEADMEVGDVVSVTTYVVADHLDDLGVVMAARDRALGGHRAASTLVTVPALAQPQWKMEVAIVASA